MAHDAERSEKSDERADPERFAQKMQERVEQMERRSHALAEEIDETRQEWERKRDDEDVPGAVPPRDGDSEPS